MSDEVTKDTIRNSLMNVVNSAVSSADYMDAEQAARENDRSARREYGDGYSNELNHLRSRRDDVIDAVYDLTDHCRFGQKVSQQQFIRTLTTSEYQFLHWFLGRIDRTAAETFLGNLANLDGLRDGDPIYTLAKRLNQGKDSLTGKMRLHAIVTAWNAWRRGEKLSVIRVANLESEPAIPQAI